MSLEWFLPIGYIFLIVLLLLRDNYYSQRIKKKRLDGRTNACWPAIIQTSIGSIHGRTQNISVSGALISCLQPLPLGEIVRVNIKVSGRLLEILAEVVRSHIYHSDDTDIPQHQIGVRFKHISDQDSRFLALTVYDSLMEDEQQQSRPVAESG